MPSMIQRRSLALRTAALALAAALGGCGTLPQQGPFEPADGAPEQPVDVSAVPDAVPRVEPYSKYGNPGFYTVGSRRYEVAADSSGYVERGIASWYGTKFHGKRTSSGEPYDMYAMTAAHKTLPLPTYVQVTNLGNGRRVIVKINDRGPFKENRLIDLSYAAATRLGIVATGTGLVEVRAIDPEQYLAQQRAAEAQAATAARLGPQKPVGLYLQVGAFSQRENAERLRARLNAIATQNVHIVPAEEAQQTLYRVRIGPIPDVDEADRVSRELNAAGLSDPRIVID